MINAQTIINQVMQAHAVAPDEATSFITFKTSERGRHRVQDCKNNLQRFADLVRKNATAFGGGLVRTAKARAAVLWSPRLITVFKQAIEDGDYQAALDIAEQSLGALFYLTSKGTAVMQVAPIPLDSDARLVSAMNENGTYAVSDPVSMFSVNGYLTRSKRSRQAQIDQVMAKYKDATDETKTAMFAKASLTPADQPAIRAQWLQEHGLDDALAIQARIDEQARREADYQVTRQAREAVAQVVADAVAAVAITEAMAPSESRELVTCEAGEGEAHDVSMGSASGFSVAAYERVTGLLASFKPAGTAPDPSVTEFLEAADPTVVEFLPAFESSYSLPIKSVYDDWNGYKSKDFAPNSRQQMVIDAVQVALNEKLFYTTDVLARCVELLNIDTETQAIKSKRVEGGDVGMDIYYARNHIEAKNAREYADKIKAEMNLRVGEVLGPLVFTDYKRTTGVTITEVSPAGFTFTGKRGIQTVSGTASADQLKCGIERAFTTGKRKTDYPAFIERRIATGPQAVESAPNSEGQRIRAAAGKMREQFPAIAAKYDDLATSHDLKDEREARQDAPAVTASPTVKSESGAWTDERCEATLQAQDRPTVSSKSGKWCAWLYVDGLGLHGLRFESEGVNRASSHPTAGERMQALAAMGRAADAAMAAPDDTPPPVTEFLAAEAPPVAEFLGEPPVAVSAEPLHPRNYVPADGVHIVDDAFEAWTYQVGAKFCFVMYLGKSAKSWKHFNYRSVDARDAGLKHYADDARDIAARKAKRKVEAKAQSDKPHGLQVGDVVRSSWGYEQTNVNHYQIIKVIGKRTVEVRELAEHNEDTGDMTGRVTPIPDDFVGEVMRRQVDRCGAVNMLSATYGRAYKIEPVAVVHGVRCYAASSYSSYA